MSFLSKTSPNNSGTFPLTLTLDVAGQGLSIFQDSVNGWQQGHPPGDNMPQQVAFLHLHKLTDSQNPFNCAVLLADMQKWLGF
ncbi:unnamed protein product [Arctogadus glacialis]